MIYTHTHNKTTLFAFSGRLIGVLLLCIYVQACVCYPLIRVVKLNSLHETVAERSRANRKTTQLVFTRDRVKEIHWKHRKEMEYNHRMYDVLSIKRYGDKVIFTCFADEEEDAENVVWHHWKNKHHDHHSHKSKKTVGGILESPPFPMEAGLTGMWELQKLTRQPFERTSAYLSRDLKPCTHPPEYVGV